MKAEIEKAVKWAGGKTWLAARCGVGDRAVGHWCQDGKMPKTPALLLNLLSKGKLKVERLTRP